MSANLSENTKVNGTSPGLQSYLLKFVAVTAVLLIVIPLVPGLLSNLAYSFSGDKPKIYWYLSRSAGLVALTILWLSMILGLGLTNKMARRWPGAPAAFAVHEFVSLLGLAFAAYHGLVLMGDHFVDFSLPRLLTPFSIAWKTFWIGLGQVSFYIWAIVTASFYVRRRIGQKTWRLIHYVNFATYTMGILHGIFTGTDSELNGVRWYYLVSAGSLLALLAYRIYDATLKKRNFSLAGFIRQRVQEIAQALQALQHTTGLSKTRSVPEALRREQGSSNMSVIDTPAKDTKDIVDTPVVTSPTPPETVSENPVQASLDQKTQPQNSTSQKNENQSTLPQNPAPAEANSPEPVPEVEETTFAPAIRLGKNSPENKVNVRIFKEPVTGPRPREMPKAPEGKRNNKDTLVVRLKKDLRVTPIQPIEPKQPSKRVVILEE